MLRRHPFPHPLSHMYFSRSKHLEPTFFFLLRSNLAEMEDLFYDLSSFAKDDPAVEGMNLVDTIKSVKPTILIGKLCIVTKHSESHSIIITATI